MDIIIAIALWCGSPVTKTDVTKVNDCRTRLMACIVVKKSSGTEVLYQDCFEKEKLQ